MAIRTHVSACVTNAHLDEVLNALRDLNPDIGPAVVSRSSGAGATVGVTASIPGDVRAAAERRLRALRDLEFGISVNDIA